MPTIRLNVAGRIPRAGANLATIRAIAERLGRDVDNFAALALIESSQRILEDDDTDLKDAIAKANEAPHGEQIDLRLDLILEQGVTPALSDMDRIASDLGVSRARMILCILPVFAIDTREKLDSPEAQAYWDAVAREIAELPEGHTDSM